MLTPRRILRTKWFHNPWTCGSYSHLAKGCSEKDLENTMEPLPTNASHLQVHLLMCFFLGVGFFFFLFQNKKLGFFCPSVLTTLLCFSPFRCCLLERLLILTSTPPSMEQLPVDGEKLIDSSLTTPEAKI